MLKACVMGRFDNKKKKNTERPKRKPTMVKIKTR